jgi:hypothetical protein
MAKAKDLIIGGLALAGSVTLANAAIDYTLNRTINNISYTLGKANVSLADIGRGVVGITLPVFILNKNEFSIKIDKFLGNVAYGAVPLGNILIPNQFNLISGENIALDLFFEVNISNTVQGVFSAAQNGGFGAILDKIYLKGELFVLGGSIFGQIKIPIETTINIV